MGRHGDAGIQLWWGLEHGSQGVPLVHLGEPLISWLAGQQAIAAGQIRHIDDLVRIEDEQALDEVGQLAHVAGPGVLHQGLHARWVRRMILVLFGMAIEQLLQQQRDVVGPIPQGASRWGTH
jgi:hypothetical protein